MELFNPIQYLMIDLANHFGLDKNDWQTRIKFVESNLDKIENMIPSAEEPVLAYASYQALLKAMAGEEIGYCISLDATSSGSQWLALLTHDENAAKMCNAVNANVRRDLYSEIYLYMKQRGASNTLQREDVKKAIMTSLYGSTAIPKQVFGDGNLYQIFQETMHENMPDCWALNELLLDLWDPNAKEYCWVMPDNFHVVNKVMTTEREVVSFLNNTYQITHEVNKPIPKGRSLCANMVHSVDGMTVREMARRCMFNKEHIEHIKELLNNWKEIDAETVPIPSVKLQMLLLNARDSGFYSVRIFDYLHSEEDLVCINQLDLMELKKIINSMPDKPFSVYAVHDCFRCHPNYGNDIRKQYNCIMQQVADSNLLEYLLKQIVGKKVSIKLTRTLGYGPINSNYALS